MYNVMTENEIHRLMALTPISFHRLIFFSFIIYLLYYLTTQCKPHPAPTQGTNNTKAKRLVSESMDQIIKNTITVNTKKKKKIQNTKSNKYKLLCWQREITYTYLIFLFYYQYVVQL